MKCGCGKEVSSFVTLDTPKGVVTFCFSCAKSDLRWDSNGNPKYRRPKFPDCSIQISSARAAATIELISNLLTSIFEPRPDQVRDAEEAMVSLGAMLEMDDTYSWAEFPSGGVT